MFKKQILHLLIFLLLIAGCTERDRTNPFDAKGKYKAPVSLSLEQRSNYIFFSWTVEDIVDYTGFRIYKSVDDSLHFTLLRELPAQASNTYDTEIEYGRKYFYYITVMGPGIESSPSATERIIPGPGDTWILSRYGYAVRHLSYDLQRIISTFNLNYPPLNWDFSASNSFIWLAYPEYGTVSRLNLEMGYEDFMYQRNLQSPEDVRSADLLDRVYILDSEINGVLLLQQESIIDTLEMPGREPMKILFTPSLNLWVLDSADVRGFQDNGSPFRTVPFSPGQKGRDMIYQSGKLYVLAGDETGTTIYSFGETQNPVSLADFTGNFQLIRKSEVSDNLWAAEKRGENKYRIVKLSPEGQRLLELPAMHRITDFAINSSDGSLVVVERYEDKISLYDREGNFIAMNDRIYDPIRVLIK